MKKENLTYQVINNINYKKNLQLCALFKIEHERVKGKCLDERMQGENYVLGLFKRKTSEYFELPLIHKNKNKFESFELDIGSNELYKKLIIFLEVNYSKDGPFRLFDFLNKVHDAIHTKANLDNLDRLVCSYSYTTSKEDERNKIYFSHFLINTKGKKRTLENFQKTEKLLPYANELIGDKNISVCFTSYFKDEFIEKRDIKEKFQE